MAPINADHSARDAGGLSGLFAQHRAELLRFLAARCGDPAEAEDFLQELWIKVSGLAAGPIANGRAYLFRMANNLVLDSRRAAMRAMRRDRSWLEDAGGGATAPEDRPDPAPQADEQLSRTEEADILRKAIAALPPGAQRALVLVRLEGCPQAEAAEIMGISRSGVEKHLAVAMRHLKIALADCGLPGAAASQDQGQPGGGVPPMDRKP